LAAPGAQIRKSIIGGIRPLLQVENPEKKLRDLLTVRDPLYREVAHFIVETNQGAARDLAQKILQLILSKQI
jgi:shikimate kinase